MARTVMSWSQTIWQDSRTPVTPLAVSTWRSATRHPRRLAFDELDAAGRAARVAAARVQDVDVGILLDRQHQALACFHFDGREPFTVSFGIALLDRVQTYGHGTRRLPCRRRKAGGPRSLRAVRPATSPMPGGCPRRARAPLRCSGRCSARRRGGGTRPPASSRGLLAGAAQHQRPARRLERAAPGPRAPAARWRRSPSCCAAGRSRSAAARRCDR